MPADTSIVTPPENIRLIPAALKPGHAEAAREAIPPR